MSDLKVYENILVSGEHHNFSASLHEWIPHRLLADWAFLTSKIAAAIEPAFNIPPFPERVEFKTETTHSDGPYSASEDYYILDYVYYDLTGQDFGIRISFENGRREGDNPVTMETLGCSSHSANFQPNYLASSSIPGSAATALARFFVWHAPEKTPEIEAIFARHQKDCLSL